MKKVMLMREILCQFMIRYCIWIYYSAGNTSQLLLALFFGLVCFIVSLHF